jgi:tripartite motif-containing protein 71
MQTSNGGSLLRAARMGFAAKVATGVLLALLAVAAMASAAQAGTPAFSLSFKNSEGGSTPLSSPVGVGTDSAGNVYVANSMAGKIEKFSPSGTYLAKFGSYGYGTGQLAEPVAVDVDPSGNVWVADNRAHRIVEFSSTGTFLRQVSTPERPLAIATDGLGNVWWSGGEEAYGALWKLDATGKYTVGVSGIYHSHGLDVDGAGNVWVTDDSGAREYTSAGVFIRSWTVGTVPAGISADSSGNLWIAVGCQVKKYSPLGAALDAFGKCYAAPANFQNLSPRDGIAVSPGGPIWVAISRNGVNEIQKWVPTP